MAIHEHTPPPRPPRGGSTQGECRLSPLIEASGDARTEQFNLGHLGRLLRHVMLVKAVGSDYEFRIVGDVQVQAYGESYQGMLLSDVALTHRKFAEGTRMLYDASRLGGYAFGYRGWIGRDMPDTRYSYHEVGFFPLGPEEGAVDHLLIAGVYAPRGEFQSE